MKKFHLKWIVRASFVALLTWCMVSCRPVNYEEQYRHLADAYLLYFNTGDLTGVEDVLQPDFKIYFSPSFELAVEGIDAYREEIEGYRKVESRLELEEAVYGPDAITVRWIITQNYPDSTGALTIPLSGKGISLLHIRDGKLADEWIAFDMKAWMEQLGFEMVKKEPAAAAQ